MQEATLLYVIKNGKILLIRKKRGIGAGKINGSGGHINKGEQPRDAAIRETFEELEIMPVDLNMVGVNTFHYGKNNMRVYVFVSSAYEGEPTETEEATPLWTDVDKIPYSEMWADDVHWFPMMLENKKFDFAFYYDERLENILRIVNNLTGEFQKVN